MKPSPLQIEHYFVSDLHFSVNASFDVKKDVELSDDQFLVESFLLHDDKAPEKWQITLRIKHQPLQSANAPYAFTLDIVGYFNVAAAFPKEKAERMVKTNGSSMLYSIAREIVRSVTGSGPYRALLLPSVSFYEAVPAAPGQLPEPPSK